MWTLLDRTTLLLVTESFVTNFIKAESSSTVIYKYFNNLPRISICKKKKKKTKGNVTALQ